MIQSVETFKSEAVVVMSHNPTNGFYTVLLRNPSGEVHDKVSCDTFRVASEYRRAFVKIAKNYWK